MLFFEDMFNSILIGSVLVFVGCTMNFIETMRSKSRSPSLRPLSKGSLMEPHNWGFVGLECSFL